MNINVVQLTYQKINVVQLMIDNFLRVNLYGI